MDNSINIKMAGEDLPYLFDFKKIGDSSLGFISIAENEQIPFRVERVYWTYFTPNDVIRGNHAHKNLQQIIVAASGLINVETEMLNGTKSFFSLSKPNEGLYLPSFCWRKLQFSHSAVLLCLASKVFEESDYIRDYEAFKKYINK